MRVKIMNVWNFSSDVCVCVCKGIKIMIDCIFKITLYIPYKELLWMLYMARIKIQTRSMCDITRSSRKYMYELQICILLL